MKNKALYIAGGSVATLGLLYWFVKSLPYGNQTGASAALATKEPAALPTSPTIMDKVIETVKDVANTATTVAEPAITLINANSSKYIPEMIRQFSHKPIVAGEYARHNFGQFSVKYAYGSDKDKHWYSITMGSSAMIHDAIQLGYMTAGRKWTAKAAAL